MDKIDEMVESMSPEERAELELVLSKAEEERAREGSSFFTEYVMRDQNNEPIEQADIHEKWHKHLNENRFTQIIAPRDHGKTTQIIAWVLWRLGNNPNLRIKYICQTDSQAKKRLSQIKQYILESEEYQKIFPEIRPSNDVDDWSKHSITVEREARSKDSTLEAWGVLSSATGGRADIIIMDDVVDLKNAIQQPKLREQVKTQFRENWLNLLEPSSEVKYIATKWHESDLTCELADGDSFDTFEYSIDEDFTPIWPEKWDEEALRQKYKDLGSQAFNRGFRNQPVSDDDRTFDEEVIQTIGGGKANRQLLKRYKGNNIYVGLDPAIGSSPGSSYSVIFTTLVDSDNIRHPIDIRRGQWKSHRLIDEIIEINELFNPNVIMVENNSFQEVLVEWIEAKSIMGGSDINIQGHTTGYQKVDLQVGVPSLAIEMEQGKWEADYDYESHKNDGCSCVFCKWISELMSFPYGQTTDIVMANWLCLQAIRLGHVSHASYDKQAEYIDEFLRRNFEVEQNRPKGVIDIDVFH